MQARTAVPAAQAGPAPKPRRKPTSTDASIWPKGENWLYKQALASVCRRRVTTAAELARDLDVGTGTARALLARMVEEGEVADADMFGAYTRLQPAQQGEGTDHVGS